MEYIKPYLLSIFEKVVKLMEKNIFITDLKLPNTLYDIYLLKGIIIDAGGSV